MNPSLNPTSNLKTHHLSIGFSFISTLKQKKIHSVSFSVDVQISKLWLEESVHSYRNRQALRWNRWFRIKIGRNQNGISQNRLIPFQFRLIPRPLSSNCNKFSSISVILQRKNCQRLHTVGF